MHARKAIDRLRLVYVVVIATQVGSLALFEAGLLDKSVAAVAGAATSLVGPLLSFAVSVHVFRHRHRSRFMDLASVATTYIVTCLSFALLYWILADNEPAAFNLPAGMHARLDLGTALYFSVVTITTTGYGDVSPASGLARLTAYWEIVIGLLYQVFVFSLVATLVATPSSLTLEQKGSP